MDESSETVRDEADPLIDSPPTTTKPPSQLRARIMATGYRYKQLNEDSSMDFDEDETQPPRRCCFRTSPMLVIVTLLACTVAVLLLTLAIVVGDRTNNQQPAYVLDGHKPCLTSGCVKTSAAIFSRMDINADPCTDMYRFACGGWIDKNSLPPGYGKWSVFSEVSAKNDQIIRKLLDNASTEFKGRNSSAVAKFKTVYRTCMDVEAIEAVGTTRVLEVISKLGSWTVTSGVNAMSWNREKWNIEDSLLAIHGAFAGPLFRFYVGTDDKDTNKMVIVFGQTGLTLAYLSEYSGNMSQKVKDAYMAFSTEVGVLLGGDRKTVQKKMEEVYALEKELAEIFVPLANMSDPRSVYNKMTLKEFQDLLGPWINIQNYLIQSFHGQHFQSDEPLVIKTPSYFKRLGEVVKKTDKEVLANYMMWSLIQNLISYLPVAFTKASLALLKVETGVSAIPDRYRHCMAIAENAVGYAASALYIDNNFEPSAKEKVVFALEKVKKEFIENLYTVPWLDITTRERLKIKAELTKYKVGYPDWILDPEELDTFYKKLTIKQGAFFENRFSVKEFIINHNLNKYGKSPDKAEWPIYPSSVNAFHESLLNEVVVPAGILQEPFFSTHFPKPFIYSSLGMVVGHELTHGFDNSGRMYDKNGNLGNQWTPNATQKYQEQTQCMMNQYSNFSIMGHQLNGYTTLNENIADNGGLLLAYRAFKNDKTTKDFQLPGMNFTDDQMFFLGFSQLWCGISTKEYTVEAIATDPHTLGEFRVKGVTNNVPEFAAAFKCQQNPDVKRCRVW